MATPKRTVRFSVIRDVLVREVSDPDGRGYEQRVSLGALLEVAHALERCAKSGTAVEALWEALFETLATGD